MPNIKVSRFDIFTIKDKDILKGNVYSGYFTLKYIYELNKDSKFNLFRKGKQFKLNNDSKSVIIDFIDLSTKRRVKINVELEVYITQLNNDLLIKICKSLLRHKDINKCFVSFSTL